MFTGIIEEVGKVAGIEGGKDAFVLRIEADKVLKDVKLGDSIAVNGVCLTVTTFTRNQFTADVMPETLKHTNLRTLKKGELVNLERAMALGDRFGGHIVSGHVDATGEVISREPRANAILFRIKAPAHIRKYLVPKGSVTVDGISLTIVDVTDETFSVSVIPHTLSHTNLRDKHPGSVVNLESDIIGKYVERLLSWREEEKDPAKQRMNMDFLRNHGFV